MLGDYYLDQHLPNLPCCSLIHMSSTKLPWAYCVSGGQGQVAKCGNENQAGEDQGVTPGRWLRKWQKGQCLPQMISQEDGGRGGDSETGRAFDTSYRAFWAYRVTSQSSEQILETRGHSYCPPFTNVDTEQFGLCPKSHKLGSGGLQCLTLA
jgi:hypothetical protein